MPKDKLRARPGLTKILKPCSTKNKGQVFGDLSYQQSLQSNSNASRRSRTLSSPYAPSSSHASSYEPPNASPTYASPNASPKHQLPDLRLNIWKYPS